MKLSSIYNFLKNKISYADILYECRDEIDEYVRRSHIQGASMPVKGIEDIYDFTIGKSELKILCNSYLNDQLDEVHLNYIVDILQLSQKVHFEDDDIEDDFLSLTDPEINGKLTKNKVLDIIMKYS